MRFTDVWGVGTRFTGDWMTVTRFTSSWMAIKKFTEGWMAVTRFTDTWMFGKKFIEGIAWLAQGSLVISGWESLQEVGGLAQDSRTVGWLLQGSLKFGWLLWRSLALSAGAVEYTDYISVQSKTNQRVSLICHWWWGSSKTVVLGNAEYPFIVIAPRFTLARSGGTW